MNGYEVPILIIAFNRPDKLRSVIDSVRNAKPSKLFVFVDGPRPNDPNDVEKIGLVKEVVAKSIDWSCDLKTLYQEKNLGCRYGPAAAITWFFKEVEAGIILEDDCVPNETFFPYIQELLQRYKDTERVMLISGINFTGSIRQGRTSYYFSKYVFIWGWASWRRAWRHFDENLIAGSDQNQVWDSAWKASVEKAGGFDILPRVNLVENIGFGNDATHTTEMNLDTKSQPMAFPLIHPKKVRWDALSDYYTYKHLYGRGPGKALLTVIRRTLSLARRKN